jgi:fumarylpyruvate hydrolase
MHDAAPPRYAIPLWPQPALPVEADSAPFPVRRIYCVGRNYAAHAREMGGDPTREPPFFFAKPPDAIVPGGGSLAFPVATENLHHEFELVVAIGKGGADIAEAAALAHVFGYAAGLDMTRRDLQDAAKNQARPWDMSKGFDQSAPCSPLRRASAIGHPAKGEIVLTVDGTVRQKGDLSQMIWSVPEVIAHLSRLVRLEAGDLIFTGTPDGVGRVTKGSKLAGRIEGVGELAVQYR